MFIILVALALAVSSCGNPSPTTTSAPAAAPAQDATMQLHHLHGLMAHGFEMALEGASMKMLGQMKMAGAVDTVAITHGDAMLTEGKSLVNWTLNGSAMTAMHPAAGVTDPSMAYSHDLGKAMVTVIEQFEQMPAVNPKDPRDMALHHMHLALAHAAEMASQAAALNMTAAMKMAGSVDDEATKHAAAMAAHARSLYDESIKGEAMTDAMKGAAATAPGMTGTHALGDSVNTVIELLSKMP